MYISSVVQNLFGFAFAITWIAVGATMALRARAKQRDYLRRFPPIDRYQTLDMYTPWIGNNPPGTYRRIVEASWKYQDDPELERLRREIWRYTRYYIIWLFGFPFLTFGVLALLIATGLVHPQ